MKSQELSFSPLLHMHMFRLPVICFVTVDTGQVNNLHSKHYKILLSRM